MRMRRSVSVTGVGVMKGCVAGGRVVGGLVGDRVRVLGVLDVSWPLVPRVAMVVIVDGIGGAPFEWIVRKTVRRVPVPASSRQLHRTCSAQWLEEREGVYEARDGTM